MELNDNVIESIYIEPYYKDYLYDRLEFAEEHGFKVTLSNKKFKKIDNDFPCAGYFSEEDREIFLCMNNPGILYVIVHEFCHLDQYLTECKAWKDLNKLGKDLYVLHGEYIEGKNMPKSLAKDALKATRNFELDCEKRAAKQIIKYHLPMDVEEYVRSANAYVFLYNAMHEARKTIVPLCSPTNIPEIYTKLPAHFNNDYDVMPEGYFKKVKKHCLKI